MPPYKTAAHASATSQTNAYLSSFVSFVNGVVTPTLAGVTGIDTARMRPSMPYAPLSSRGGPRGGARGASQTVKPRMNVASPRFATPVSTPTIGASGARGVGQRMEMTPVGRSILKDGTRIVNANGGTDSVTRLQQQGSKESRIIER